MKSTEDRQAELRRMDLWLRQHPARSKLIAFVIGLLFFGLCTLVLDSPSSASGAAFQIFACVLVVPLWIETVVLILPERWRQRIFELQFGPRWTKENSRRD